MILFSLNEICKQSGLNERAVRVLIEREWLIPAHQNEFDAEDLARLNLICELEKDFGANEASIPIILHLIDQLHYFRGKIHEIRDHL